MQQRFFITATGTNIGKTFITAALVRQATALGRSVMAYKPVISGFDPACSAESDTGMLCAALGLPLTHATIARISPFRYAAPLAPSLAARLENRVLDFDALVTMTQNHLAGPEEIILIEGVGGIMVPLTDTHTICDWIAAITLPAILVTGSYLGTLSHTLTAIESLQTRNIPLHAVIVSQSPDTTEQTLHQTTDELVRWMRNFDLTLPVIPITRRTEPEGWRDVPELQKILLLSQ